MASGSVNFNEELMDRLAERTAPTEGVWFPLSLTMADWWAVSHCLYFPASLSHLFPLYSSFCQYGTEISAGVTTAICPRHESEERVYGAAVFHQPLHLCTRIWSGVRWMHIWELSRVKPCDWIPLRDELRTRVMLSLGKVIFAQKVVQSSSKRHCHWITMAKSNILMGASILFYKHRAVRALV